MNIQLLTHDWQYADYLRSPLFDGDSRRTQDETAFLHGTRRGYTDQCFTGTCEQHRDSVNMKRHW